METIKIVNPHNLPTMSLADIKKQYVPNALKEKKGRDVARLKESILQLGFIVPIVIWGKGKYITDGAGRIMALDMLEYEGYTIPEIPYYLLDAATKKEAKAQTLAISSQYGKITEETAGDFLGDMNELDLGFVSLPGINLEDIDVNPVETPKKKSKGGKGDTSKSRLQHRCPKCHHEFYSSDE